MTRPRAEGALLLLLFACAPPAALPIPEGPIGFPVDPAFTGDVAFNGATVRYYAITARDDIEALGAIRREGPRLGDSTHGASTGWDVRWAWPDGGACAPVTLTVDIVVTFPRWTAPAEAPAHAVGNWQRYVRALAVHEQGHIDRILGVVEQIPRVLEAAGCAAIPTKGAEALALLADVNAAYDTETRNGAEQGAELFAPRAR
ncbi:MAG: DUF922 domain-containing protein [Pseudomonadota bacterium]|nr:DUF922 domain-containing protein [Pseudomonadota bacterium]